MLGFPRSLKKTCILDNKILDKTVHITLHEVSSFLVVKV